MFNKPNNSFPYLLGSKNIKSNHKLSANSKHFFTKKIEKKTFQVSCLGIHPQKVVFPFDDKKLLLFLLL